MQDLKSKIVKLRQKIQDYNYHYYTLDTPLIEDSEYDALFRELQSLEAKYPETITADSPTQQVGTLDVNSFQSIQHRTPMLSLANAFFVSELEAFDRRVHNRLDKSTTIEYVCEPKIDGVAVNLLYYQGKFYHGATRGNGMTGEDITHNLKTITDIPIFLSEKNPPQWLEIRGEVYIKKSDFQDLNQALQKSQKKTFVNARNAASGSLRQLDPTITAQRPRPLSFFAHGYGKETHLYTDDAVTHYAILTQLKAWGFPYCPMVKIAQGINGCLDYYQHLKKIRDSLPYEIDGVVYKVNLLHDQSKLGLSARTPRWAIAHKFPAEEAKTKLLAVDFQVSRTAVLTPVARIHPVFVGGATIRNVTLHNFREIQRKAIHLDDEIIVRRAGDVIPEIVSIRQELRSPSAQAIAYPTHCPVCGSKTQKIENKVAIYCTGYLICSAQRKARLLHFVSRQAMDIQGLGEKLVTQLIKQGIVHNIVNIYELTLEKLVSLERMGKRSAEKLLHQITASKNTTFARFLYSLGIPGVGSTLALQLSQYFLNLDDILHATPSELENLSEIGPVLSKQISSFFQVPEHIEIIKQLQAHGIHWANSQTQAVGPLAGKSFAITGKLQLGSRETVANMLQAKGAILHKQLSSKTNYLIIGDAPGAKASKAKQLNITILSENELQKWIQ